MYEEILYEVKDPIATIQLNRPDRLNALTGRTLVELRHALGEAERDDHVVGILLTGAGRGFCAGMDMDSLDRAAREGTGSEQSRAEIPELEASPGDPALSEDFRVGFGFLLAIRKPILAAVNGPVAGLGFSIALLRDLRFASEKAIFTTAFSQRGLIAEHGQSWMLPRLVGPSHALDLLWSARRVEAAEALRIGLVNRVFPPDRLLPEARAYLQDLAENVSPTSIKVMKQQVYKHLMAPLGDALRESNQLMEESLHREDFHEGVRSFIERRPPRFPRLRTD